MLQEPWKDVICHGQIFSASLLDICQEGSHNLLNGLGGLLRLAMSFRVAPGRVFQHGLRVTSFIPHSFEEAIDL